MPELFRDVLTGDKNGLRLSIVVPTFNEKGNIEELIQRVDRALGREGWEIIFVDDDSPDGTAEVVRCIAQRDSRIRVLQRIGRRGLSSACIEGMLAASSDVIAVMDADLQHDEGQLPAMKRAIEESEVELVIATRYSNGGSTGDWDKTRAGISRFATQLSRLVLRQSLSDPMSGFFMLRRVVLSETVHGLSALGFKILLDIVATSNRELKIAEVPYTFRSRFAGESKLDSMAAWDFIMLLADKTIGQYVPVRFIAFGLVGGLGLVVHLAVLMIVFRVMALEFVVGQAIATMTAMVFNFSVNNVLTYRDKRLHGYQWWIGLASFSVACSVGAIANVGIAGYLYKGDAQWVLAAIAGVAVGAVWNYAITQIYTWGNSKKEV